MSSDPTIKGPPPPVSPAAPDEPQTEIPADLPAAASTAPQPDPPVLPAADVFAGDPPPELPQPVVTRTLGAALYSTQPKGEEHRLDSGRILQLVLNRENPLPGVVGYSNLGDHYILKKSEWKRESEGIHTWDDLRSFIMTALSQVMGEKSIEIEIDQYNFPTLLPPDEFLMTLSRVVISKKKSLTLVVKGDPMEPPILYRFGDEIMHTSFANPDQEAIAYWEQMKDQSDSYQLNLADHEKFLIEAMSEADRESEGEDLGKYLDRVIQIINANPEKTPPIDLNKKTQIFGLLDRCRTSVISAGAMQLQKLSPNEIPPGVLHWNPVDTFLRKHPANRSPGNCWYSIGAGQMISIFELTRTLMDRGALPLDFRLLADNRVDDSSYSSVWEVNTLGTRQQLLGQVPINTPARKKIYVLNERQRAEALRTYQPAAIFLNVKGNKLSKVLDGPVLQALSEFAVPPTIVTPAKSYGDESPILYLDLLDRLVAIDPRLADRLVVMGGYFAASWMLEGKKVDITLASQLDVGLSTIAHGISPTPMDPETNKADWEMANVKLIPNIELAAALMAGGANKNFLTYRSARLVMRAMLAVSDSPSAGDLDPLDQLLENEKEKNISIGEEITARLAPIYQLTTYHVWSPQGLIQDFRNCLPRNLRDLLTIRKKLDIILREGGGDELDLLIEEIRLKLGGGTRNARDGFIDEIIFHAYTRFRERGIVDEAGFQEFYSAHYPEKWKGEGAQEGRNGIGPLILFATRMGITLPVEVYEAWNLYHPEAPITVIPKEQEKLFLGEEANLHPLWGVPLAWLKKLRNVMDALRRMMSLAARSEIGITNEIILKGLEHMHEVLKLLPEEECRYVEISRRLISAKDGVEFLVDFFKHPITEERRKNALKIFRETVDFVLKIIDEPPNSVTELASSLREVNIQLYRVELEIKRELKIKLGLAEAPPAISLFPLTPTVPGGVSRPSRRSGALVSVTPPAGVNVPGSPSPKGTGEPEALGHLAIMAGGNQLAEAGQDPSSIEMGRYQFDGTAALDVSAQVFAVPQTEAPKRRPHLRLVGKSEVLAKPTIRLVSGESGEELESDVGRKKKTAKKPVRPNATLPVQNQARVLPFRGVLIGR